MIRIKKFTYMFPARFFTFKLSPKYTSALTNLERKTTKEINTTKTIQQTWLLNGIIAPWLPVLAYLSVRIGHLNQSNSPVKTTDNDSLSQFRSPDQITCPVFACIITPDVSFPDFSDHVLQVFRVNINAIFGSILHEQAVSFVQTIVSKKPPRRLWYPP